MSLGFVVVQLDVTVVNVAVKSIGAALGGGMAGIQWVVNAYTIAFASLILTAGAAADQHFVDDIKQSFRGYALVQCFTQSFLNFL
jgi:MFS family permease